ncbi:MAG: hypothetical protein KDH88_20090 [Chromatiales bacterium]|nr:hypothetical protein [Chromatiales bacterium]
MTELAQTHDGECERCLVRTAERLPWILAISAALIAVSVLYTVISHNG